VVVVALLVALFFADLDVEEIDDGGCRPSGVVHCGAVGGSFSLHSLAIALILTSRSIEDWVELLELLELRRRLLLAVDALLSMDERSSALLLSNSISSSSMNDTS
jgi:hypothetical protein